MSVEVLARMDMKQAHLLRHDLCPCRLKIYWDVPRVHFLTPIGEVVAIDHEAPMCVTSVWCPRHDLIVRSTRQGLEMVPPHTTLTLLEEDECATI
jgi:hypothetical protein